MPCASFAKRWSNTPLDRQGIDDMSEFEDRLISRELADLPAPVPSARADRRILARAELAVDRAQGPRWYAWPASIAAALVVCVGLVAQMAGLLPTDKTVVRVPPATAPAPTLEAASLEGAQALRRPRASYGSLAGPELEQELTAAMEADDPARFARLLDENPGYELRPELQAWAQRHGLDD